MEVNNIIFMPLHLLWTSKSIYDFLEALNEWEEVALHLGLSDKTIQEIRRLSDGNNLNS